MRGREREVGSEREGEEGGNVSRKGGGVRGRVKGREEKGVGREWRGSGEGEGTL